MQLKHLVDELSVVKVEGPLDREIAGISYDSRRVTPGMVSRFNRGQVVLMQPLSRRPPHLDGHIPISLRLQFADNDKRIGEVSREPQCCYAPSVHTDAP